MTGIFKREHLFIAFKNGFDTRNNLPRCCGFLAPDGTTDGEVICAGPGVKGEFRPAITDSELLPGSIHLKDVSGAVKHRQMLRQRIQDCFLEGFTLLQFLGALLDQLRQIHM